MNVWTYWEGPQPPYIQLCLSTIRSKLYRNCCYHHVNSYNIGQYIPEGVLHPNWHSIRELGVKSDCVRAAVLYLYGGLYIDADTIMLKDPTTVIDQSAEASFMVWRNPPDRVIAGYLYCKPGSSVAKRWLDNINAKLAEGKWAWTELGEQCLTPVVRDTPAGMLQELPLKTFLPIEIDCEVTEFFTPVIQRNEWWRRTTDDTIAFGLNNSWFMGRQPSAFSQPVSQMDNRILVGNLLHDALTQLEDPQIVVCCSTYKRPELASQLFYAFKMQTYENKKILFLDDSKLCRADAGYDYHIIPAMGRYDSLGAKRNAAVLAAQHQFPNADIIVPWDDDDLVMPWALESIATAAKQADWVRPSKVLVPDGDAGWVQLRTYSTLERKDFAFHPAWGITLGAFKACGGYEHVSLGEDLTLARRLCNAKVSEADSTPATKAPYYVFGPYNNEHFSYNHKDYTTWPTSQSMQAVTEEYRIEPKHSEIHSMLAMKYITHRDHILNRPFQNNWYDDEVKA